MAAEIPLRIVFAYPLSGIFLLFEYTISVTLVLDLIIRLFIPMDPGKKYSPQKNKKYPGSAGFYLDILTAVPLELLIAHELIPASFSVFALLRLIRVIRILRVFRLFDLAKILRSWDLNEFHDTLLTKLTYFGFWIILTAHWIACCWIALGFSVEEGTKIHLYVRSLYWAITTLTTIGYGDITAKTTVQTLFSIFVELLGAGLYGYVIGSIASLIANRDISKSKFSEKMARLDSFMEYKKIPQDLKNKISDYFIYLWETKRGYDETIITDGLPSALKMKVSLYLNREVFDKVPLFHNASEHIISKLVFNLKPVVCTPGEYIFEEGEIGDKMYFINRGSLEVVSGDGSQVHAVLHEGNFFGEIALLLKCPRTASVRAIDYCDLYALDKEVFDKVIMEFPDFARKVKEKAHERKQLRDSARTVAAGKKRRNKK
ncbi:MAG: cyclic nucleotide-binding domain-containing protein [Leptospira sp.]|nr:cyclic nucleotide-binding domain-containing protein [Leptospira sp.]